ncbi:MAG: type II toxin-antitoxin system ParD family antitoxin [Phycisphaerae bacterium]|nr:type II toxin-antitoxin system ParD family antitoxin [Phycisphaerae bacterium]
MAARHTLNVSLTAELEKFVASSVESGRYQTASEVVREALRLLQVQQRDRDAAHTVLKKKLKNASTQAMRGELLDGDEFIDRLLSQLEPRHGKPDAA